MLREQARLLTKAHRLADLGLTAAAFVGAYGLKKYALPPPYGGLTITPNYYLILLMILVIWYVSLNYFRVYVSSRNLRYATVFWNVLKAVSTGMLILILAIYVLKLEDLSRILLGIFFLLDIVFLAVSKRVIYQVLSRFRRNGFNFRNILIIGSRERARDVVGVIGSRLGAGFRVVGCLETRASDVGKSVRNGVKVVGTVDRLEEILRQDVVDELVFAMPLKKIASVEHHMALASEMGISVRIIPLQLPEVGALSFEDFLGIPTMTFKTTPPPQAGLLIKNALDAVSAGVCVVLLFPLFLLIAGAIKIASPGPVFFIQERCSLYGRRFKLYKFRTMVPDAEARLDEVKALNECDGPVFKITRDPRIIPWVGTFLRKTSLDELPQLINVLKGEMSLVGPRPPLPAEVGRYDAWQRRRLSMKPGLTCLWQCTARRNEISFGDWMKMDLHYIDNWSLGLDFKILLRTVMVVFSGEGR